MANPNGAPIAPETSPSLAGLFDLRGSIQAGQGDKVFSAYVESSAHGGKELRIVARCQYNQYDPSTHSSTSVADNGRPPEWVLRAHVAPDPGHQADGLGRLACVVTYNGPEFSLSGWVEPGSNLTVTWGSVILPDGRMIGLARLRAAANDVQFAGFTLKIMPEGLSNTEMPTLLTAVAAVDEEIRTAVTLLESSMPTPEV